MKNSRLPITLSLPAAVLCLAWLPARAQAQFSFVLNPATLSALPGTVGLIYSGTLTNGTLTNGILTSPGKTALTSGGHLAFNLLTGPAGVNPAIPPIYFDDFFGPNSLAPGQTTGNIFSLDIDPAAPLGTYTGNFSFDYGGHTAGQDFTVNVVPPSVPEADTLPLLALGVGYIGLTLLAARRRAVAPR